MALTAGDAPKGPGELAPALPLSLQAKGTSVVAQVTTPAARKRFERLIAPRAYLYLSGATRPVV